MTVIEARPVLPPLSVAEAVMTWVPAESVLRVMLPPVPIAPSRLEVQATTGARLPSSRSLAVAVRVVAAPISRIEPLAGAVMATVGVALTTTEIATLALLPPLSVTEAMIAWVPELSVLVVMLPPVPRTPSRLEIHEMRAARLPSSASVAVAVKVTAVPGS